MPLVTSLWVLLFSQFFTHFYSPPVVHLFLQTDGKDSLIYRQNFTANAVKCLLQPYTKKMERKEEEERNLTFLLSLALYILCHSAGIFFFHSFWRISLFLFYYIELKKVNKIFWGRNYYKRNDYSKLLNTLKERKRAHLFCGLEEHTFCQGTFHTANNFSEFYIKSYTKKLLENSHFVVSFLSRLLPQDLSLEMLLIFIPTSYIFSSCLHKIMIWTCIFIFFKRKIKIFSITVKWLASVGKRTILFSAWELFAQRF